jgi:hypothetical protein
MEIINMQNMHTIDDFINSLAFAAIFTGLMLAGSYCLFGESIRWNVVGIGLLCFFTSFLVAYAYFIDRGY